MLIFCFLQSDLRVIKLEAEPEIFTTDKLGNIYVYYNYQLKKISPTGKLIAQYSRLESGALHSIDASDPMQVLLFYKDFNQLVFLDSRLSPLGNPVLLDELNLDDVSAVCKSKQIAVWLYDEYEHKLLHYGFNPKGVIQTINLDNFAKEIHDINFLLESGNELYLNQEGKAIWVFDQFGNKLQKLDIQIHIGLQQHAGKLVYHNKKKLFFYNLRTENIDSISFQAIPSFDNARIVSGSTYILSGDSITIL